MNIRKKLSKIYKQFVCQANNVCSSLKTKNLILVGKSSQTFNQVTKCFVLNSISFQAIENDILPAGSGQCFQSEINTFSFSLMNLINNIYQFVAQNLSTPFVAR